MIDFIYTNELINLGIGASKLEVNDRKIVESELKLRIKFSSIIEDFHVFSFGVGVLIITDLDMKSLLLNRAAVLVESFYFLEHFVSDSSELNYCVEEFYTVNQYDDEYCVKIKEITIDGKRMISLKNNNQSNSFFFERTSFLKGLITFSERIISCFIKKYPDFENSPIHLQIRDKIDKVMIL